MAFELTFNDTPKNLVAKIEKAITDQDGKFNGNEKEGKIEISTPVGNVSVGYKIEGQKVNVDIIEKPIFIPEEMIKSEILKMI
ncbi:MAG TPA: hypothetical protein VJ954_00650 [Ignavibacteriaceae bacterium]|nr:hypothetical protein [Ignavibacteriaceae bacterium]